MRVLIAGATGLVGSHLLRMLLEHEQVTEVVALGRRPLSPHPKLTSKIVTFEHMSGTDHGQIDVAFSCLGTTIKTTGSKEAFKKVDHDYVIEFARAARIAGAKCFVAISALGAEEGSKVFYNKVKGQTEDDLQNIEFDSLVILRPSLLLGERSEVRPLEKIAVSLAPVLSAVLVGPLEKYKPVLAEKVARVALQRGISASKLLEIVSNSAILAFSEEKS